MPKFFIGFATAFVIMIAGVYAYVSLGMAPVATASSPLPFEKRITQMALNARIDKEAPKSSPVAGSDEAYTAGAHIYRENCAVCHGLPGLDHSAIAKGEFPKPPDLATGKGVTDDPVGETFWKVANGIRLTGMPGFRDSLSTYQMWQVSLFLANVDKLPPSARSVLQEPLPKL